MVVVDKPKITTPDDLKFKLCHNTQRPHMISTIICTIKVVKSGRY